MESHLDDGNATHCEKLVKELDSFHSNKKVMNNDHGVQTMHKKSKKISVCRSSKRYKQVSDESRQEIIRRVVIEKEKLARVARDLNVKYTTANSIINVYRKEGRVKRILQKNRKKHPVGVNSPTKQKSSIKQEPMEEKKDMKAKIKTSANKAQIEKLKEANKPLFDIPNLSNEIEYPRFSSANQNASNFGLINTDPRFALPSMGLNLPLLNSHQVLQTSPSFLSSSINPNFQISGPTLGELMHASRILSLSSNVQNAALNASTFSTTQNPVLPAEYLASLNNMPNVQNIRSFHNWPFHN